MSATTDLSDGFFRKLVEICERNGWDPRQLLGVMMSESGISAKAHNPHGNASGLIQFMPDTLRGLSWDRGDIAFRMLSAEEQLPFVERYYLPWKSYVLDSPERFYLATFLPALLMTPQSRDQTFVLCGALGPLSWAYRANKVFDRENKGWINVGDLRRSIERACHGPRWTEAMSRLEDAMKPDPMAPTRYLDESTQRSTPVTEDIEEALEDATKTRETPS